MNTPCTHLEGKNVLVTGGTRGLGLMQVDEALRCGANHVTFTSRPKEKGGNEADAENAKNFLKENYDEERFTYVESDVRQICPENEGNLVDDGACNGRVFDPEIRKSLGVPERLDSISLNAGVFGPGDETRRLDKLSMEHFDNTIRTNCTGVFHGIRDFANALQRQEVQPSNPSVVVLKSIYGSGASLFGSAGYMGSKFCANGVTKQAAIEYARPERGYPRIQINSVSPAFSKTTMTRGFWDEEKVRDEVANAHPTGTWVEGSSVAKTVTWLMNPPQNVTGADIPVDNAVMAQSVPGWSQADRIRKITGEPCCGSTE
mgnify:FL=1